MKLLTPLKLTSANGPTDGLATDQGKLSYSFDFHGSHFAVINTDPVGHDAHAPVKSYSSSLTPCSQHIWERLRRSSSNRSAGCFLSNDFHPAWGRRQGGR